MSSTATPQDVLEGRAQWAVICADNAEVLPTLPTKSVAHVITDPPYEAEAHTGGRRMKQHDPSGPRDASGWTHKIVSAPVPFAAITPGERASIAVEIARLACRWAIAFCQVEAAVTWRDALTLTGLMTARRIGVWVKPDGQPQFSGDRPGMGYESMVFTHAKGRSAWNGGGKVGVFIHNKQESADSRHGVEHPTRKPISLMLELVELFTDPGEIILDPFAGSCTTGVACLRLGRRFIGIELSEKYAAIGRERMEAESQGLSLRDVRAGQQSLFGGPP